MAYTAIPAVSGSAGALLAANNLSDVANLATAQTNMGIQSPSAVAITGGTILGVNVATATAQGAMPATDKAFLDAQFAWQRSAYQALIALVPTLTAFRYIPAGLIPLSATSGAATVDGIKEGGAVAPASATTGFFATSLLQLPKTGSWAMRLQMQFAAQVVARTAYFGLFNGAVSHAIKFGVEQAADATKWVMKIVGGATTTDLSAGASDTSEHNFDLYGNATNVILRMDGVTLITSSSLANLIDEPLFPAINATIKGDALIRQAYIGYIA